MFNQFLNCSNSLFCLQFFKGWELFLLRVLTSFEDVICLFLFFTRRAKIIYCAWYDQNRLNRTNRCSLVADQIWVRMISGQNSVTYKFGGGVSWKKTNCKNWFFVNQSEMNLEMNSITKIQLSMWIRSILFVFHSNFNYNFPF